MHPRRLSLLLAAAVAVGCAGEAPPAPDPAEAAVVELFALAAEPDPTPERIAALFGRLSGGVPPQLFDSLAALTDAGRPVVVRREELTGLDRVVFDLEAALPGGGTADYSVQVESDAEAAGRWRVVWFQGPGVAWPRHGRAGDGLSSSPGT